MSDQERNSRTHARANITNRKEESRGQKVIRFIEELCLTPEGSKVGQPLVLEEFQKKFILDIYDNPQGTRRAILSISRKNGKSAILAALLLAHIVGCERKQNTQIISGAMSRDQAALIYGLAEKMLNLQPAFNGLYRLVPSAKKIIGLKANVEYKALSADGATAHGLSPVLAILDETGQVKGSSSPFIEAITTSQGAHDNPLLITISTQAPSDADMLSLWIDDAIRSEDPHTVCHVYAADPDCDLMDKEQWKKANPALGLFRSEKDLEEQLKQASRIPSMEASARNLLLNQRVALQQLFLAATPYKECGAPVDFDVFRNNTTVIALDLSSRNDLTAAVIAAKNPEDGVIHIFPFVFCPADGIEDRSNRDKVPYAQFVRDGKMIAIGGKTMDYEQIASYLRDELHEMGITPDIVVFDRWGISHFKQAAENVGFAQGAEWQECGQGFKDMGKRCANFETLILQKRIAHGMHELFNMAFSNAIAVRDPTNAAKLDKSKSTQRIDPAVCALMAVFPISEGAGGEIDISGWIG